MRVLSPIIEPTTALLGCHFSEYLQGGSIGAKPVGDDGLWPAVALQCRLQKLEGCRAIPAFRDEDFEHLTFMIHSQPEIVFLTVDLYEDLVQMATPMWPGPQVRRSLFPDLCCEDRTVADPPETHRLMANVDPAFDQ